MVKLNKPMYTGVDTFPSIPSTPPVFPDSNEDLPKLSPSDLVEDQDSLRKIKSYMKSRYGVGEFDDATDKEVVDKFVNKMRRFRSGQSVVTLGETTWLSRASEEDRMIAANAYNTFDRLGNVFGDQNTFLEKIDGVGDYLRAAIVDPVNLVSFGAGRFFAGVGAKTTAKVVQASALNFMKKQTALGVGEKEAQKATADFVKKAIANSADKKEVIGATATDTLLSMGIDVAYQNGMIKSMQQEDYNGLQTGLAALGGLVGGSVAAASVGTRRVTKDTNLAPTRELEGKYKASQKALLQKKKELFTDSAKTVSQELLKTRAKRGMDQNVDRTSLEEEFFIRFLFGNDNPKEGLVYNGFVPNLYESGIRWSGKDRDGPITQWLANVIQGNADIKAFGEVYSIFEENFGKNFKNVLPDYNRELKEYARTGSLSSTKKLDKSPIEGHVSKGVADLTEEEKLRFFADRMSFIANRAGRFMHYLSDSAKLMKARGKIDDITMQDIIDDVGLDNMVSDAARKTLDVAQYVQNLVIRNIVTHPGTTALNLTGWSGYSFLQSTTDLIKAVLYTPTLAIPQLNKLDRDKKTTYIKGLASNQARKLRNLFDPQTTIEALESYMTVRHKEMRELMRYRTGGVESAEFAKKQFGFDPKDNPFGLAAEKYTEFMQQLFAVKGQVVLTKSVEFFYNLDKGIRKRYGQSYNDFVDSKDLFTKMSSAEYVKLEAEAVDKTLRSVFSKKFGDVGKADFTNPVKAGAFLMEEFRKVPLIGLTMPFGQFFNNTIAFMYEMSPLNAGLNFYKLFARDKMDEAGNVISRSATREDGMESVIKSSIGGALVGAYALREEKNLSEGLAWYEDRDDSTGEVRSYQYDYPYSAFKMAGRVVAHMKRGEGVPKEIMTTIGDQFLLGQMTRQLGTYEKGVYNLLNATFNGDFMLANDEAARVIGSSVSQVASGVTRPLEPFNVAFAMTRPEEYEGIDRRQGSRVLNDSMRYVEDIAKGLGLELTPEKHRASTKEKARVQAGKLVGYREVPKHSQIERMFNTIGRPNWRTGFYSNVPEADNRLNQVVFKYLEEEANRILKTGNFSKMSLKQRIEVVGKVVSRARELAKRELRTSPIREDRKLKVMFDISKNKSKSEVSKYLKAFTSTGEMSDLSLQELLLLKEMIERDRKAAKRIVLN